MLIHFQITNAEGARGGAPPADASTAGPTRCGAAARAFVLSSLIVLSIPFFAHLLVAAEEMSWRQLAQDRIERALRGAWRNFGVDGSAHQATGEAATAGAQTEGVAKFYSATLAADRAGGCWHEPSDRPLEALVSSAETQTPTRKAAGGGTVMKEDDRLEKSSIVTGAAPAIPEQASAALAVSSSADTPSATDQTPRRSNKRIRRQNLRAPLNSQPSTSYEIVGIDWVWAHMSH